MTTYARDKRCQHCQVVYPYQPSGEGCQRETNDREYCPNCKKAIIDALSKIPPRVEEFWTDTNEVTIEDIKQELEKMTKEGRWHRVCIPLFDTQDSSNHNTTGIVSLNGKDFLYSYWTKKNDVSIKVKMERDLLTGEEQEWRKMSSRY